MSIEVGSTDWRTDVDIFVEFACDAIRNCGPSAVIAIEDIVSEATRLPEDEVSITAFDAINDINP